MTKHYHCSPKVTDRVSGSHLFHVDLRMMQWLRGNCDSIVTLTVLTDYIASEIQRAEMEDKVKVEELASKWHDAGYWINFDIEWLFQETGMSKARINRALLHLRRRKIIKFRYTNPLMKSIKAKVLFDRIDSARDEIYSIMDKEEKEFSTGSKSKLAVE